MWFASPRVVLQHEPIAIVFLNHIPHVTAPELCDRGPRHVVLDDGAQDAEAVTGDGPGSSEGAAENEGDVEGEVAAAEHQVEAEEEGLERGTSEEEAHPSEEETAERLELEPEPEVSET